MRPLTDLPLFADAPLVAPSRYPYQAGFKGERGGPSELAARKIKAAATGIRGRVLREFQITAPRSWTADEIAKRLGLSILTVRPRVAELHRLGELIPTKERHENESGMTATVWRLAPAE